MPAFSPLRALLLTCICFSACFAQSLSNDQTSSIKWNAAWIACPNAPQRDAGVFYFRKEITLAAVPAHFRVHVSADNRFILHVNGAYVAEGPARGDLLHWRYESVDLAPFLHPGSNVLAAVVWNFGTRSPVAQMTSRTGFMLQGDTPAEEPANTGPSWQAKQEHGRGALENPGLRYYYYAAGPAERVDGRELDWSWDQSSASAAISPEKSETSWQPAQVIGHAAPREARDADNPWELVPDLLPPMEHHLVTAGDPVRQAGLTALPAFPAQPLDIPANSHVTLLLDNHVLQTAYPELIASAGRDAEIHLTFSEALYDANGDKGNRNEIAGRHIEGISDEFIADGGDHRTFQPLWWRTWRFLQLDITTKSQPLHLESLRAWFTAYPFEEKAHISADIPDLPALWSTGWRTARLCAHETYMDAPYWEQMQYIGDTRIQALISYAVTGDSRLGRQAITNIDASRTTDGLTQSRFPSSLPQFIPPFSLLWVSMLHDYWMYVDDEALVRETLPHTRGVIDWYAARLRSDGLLDKLGWWQFADWSSGYPAGEPPQDAEGGSTFLALQFIEALRDAAELESKYGSPERAAQYRQMIDKASASLNRLSWDSHYGLYADTPAKKSFSQQANILAVWLDVAPRDQQSQIMLRVLASSEQGPTTLSYQPIPPVSQMSYYFRFYLSRALEHAGLGDLYLDQLSPWYKMLRMGFTTWPEQPDPTRSDCHAWSASPNYDLLTVVAGIAPATPGFSRVRIAPHLGRIAPHLGRLTHLDVSMPHRAGDIHALYQRDGQEWSATITLPANLSGDFVWAGKTIALHPGEQVLHLPASKSTGSASQSAGSSIFSSVSDSSH